MFFSDCLDVNSLGHLTIGKCDVVDLAEKFGTPLYLIDEKGVRNSCRMYRESLADFYGDNTCALYASKALSCLEICRVVNDEKLGIDVVSGGEMYTALKAGFPPPKIHFHGNNKTLEEIDMAVANGVSVIVIDSFDEIEIISKISEKYNVISNVGLRLTPGIEPHTHEFIKTGQIDSKFGFNIHNGDALKAAKLVIESRNINLKEIHSHIGSQISDIKPFLLSADIMLKFLKSVADKFKFNVQSLNLGGGLGVKYTDDDNKISIKNFVKEISKFIKSKTKNYKIPIPYLYLEPGRSIVAEAGITVYRVGAIKNIPDIRTYVSIDGGLCDNPRYALYKSKYKCVLANRMDEECTSKFTIAGKCCESGDIIQEDVLLPCVKRDDILAVLSTGAYNYSMASNYNRIPKPAVVMVNDGNLKIIVKRETYEDIIRNDV